MNSLCAKKNLDETNCNIAQEKVRFLYSTLVSQVQDKYIKNLCVSSDIEPTIDAQTLFDYISTHESIPPREIEDLVELFITIAKTYSGSPIGFDTKFNINVQPNLPALCAVKHIFANMFYLTFWLVIGKYILD